MSRLRDLDERLVPAAGRALRRAGALARELTALPALRRLDRRFASTGPLGYVREVPSVGFLVVMAVFAAGALSAASLTGRTSSPPAVDNGPLVLGPAAGADVAASFAAAAARLTAVATARPGARYLALMTLTTYHPVADAAVPGVAVRRVYLRAPAVPGAQVQDVPVSAQAGPSLLTDLCTASVTRKSADAADLRQLAASVEPTTPALQQQRDELTAQATREQAEAAAYQPPCRTLFALLVEGDAARLRGLLALDGVRGVELARAGASVAELQVRPVAPEVSGVVPSAAPS